MSSHRPPVTQTTSPRQPNFLFLFTDDQRFDAAGCLGTDQLRTPHLNTLAAGGLTFTRASIMGSTMPAVCCPSRAMLMSGRTLYHAPADLAGTVTLPQWLRRHGYVTYATGKWHNQPASFAHSFSRGDRVFFGGMSNHLQVPVQDFDPRGEYGPQRQYVGKEFSSKLFSDAAGEFLRTYDSDQPFFAYVSYTAPHDPRMAPASYEALYPRDDLQLPPNILPEHPFDNGEMTIRDEQLAPWPRTPGVIREHVGAYYAMITHLDEQIGRVLAALEESGRADDTIVIFAGDNGLAVGQHGLLGKQNLYEHSVRVPLVMAGPGVPSGGTCPAPCYLLDLFPTLCDLSGLPTPAGVEGRSLLPQIRNPAAPGRCSLFYAYRQVQRAVSDDRFKLIQYTVGDSRRRQLFDLQEDPWELRDLARDPLVADRLDHLRGEMQRWQRQVNDPLPASGE